MTGLTVMGRGNTSPESSSGQQDGMTVIPRHRSDARSAAARLMKPAAMGNLTTPPKRQHPLFWKVAVARIQRIRAVYASAEVS